MFNIERCDFLDLFFDPEALRRLYWIRVKPDHRIDDQLTIKRITGDLPAPERSGSWSSTNIAMGVVNRSVTGTAKSLLIRKPVWSAAKMATDGNHVIDSPHVSHNPESALEFPSLIHSQTIDRDMADLENRRRFIENRGKEKVKEVTPFYIEHSAPAGASCASNRLLC